MCLPVIIYTLVIVVKTRASNKKTVIKKRALGQADFPSHATTLGAREKKHDARPYFKSFFALLTRGPATERIVLVVVVALHSR